MAGAVFCGFNRSRMLGALGVLSKLCGWALPTVAAAATLRKPSAARMKLAHPTPVRLTPELLLRLDAWRGDRMSRSTAIRLLLEQALKR